MKRLFTIIVLFISCIAFAQVNTAKTGIRVITATELVQDMQVGWNLGNTLDAYGSWVTGLNTETCWGVPKTTKAMIDEIAKMGFKTIRIPVTWRGHFSAANDYTIAKEWLDRVEEVANYAFANEMYVIINIHHDNPWIKLTETDKDTVKYQLNRIWTQIAERFADYGDYLVFETLNEPRTEGSPNEWNGGTSTERAILNEYHKTCVDAIRATSVYNSLRKIMISTYGASTADAAMNDLIIPNNDSNIIISLHSYFPYNFCLGKTDNTWGTNTDKQKLDEEMDKIHTKFIANGIPVIMGEWCSDNDNYADRVLHADYYIKACAKRGLVPLYWDTNKGLLNRNTLAWVAPDIIDICIKGTSKQQCTPTTLTPYYQIGTGNQVQSTYLSSITEGGTCKFKLNHSDAKEVAWVIPKGDTIVGNELIVNPVTLQDSSFYQGYLINSEGCKSWEYFRVYVKALPTDISDISVNETTDFSDVKITVSDDIAVNYNLNNASNLSMRLVSLSGITIAERNINSQQMGKHSQIFNLQVSNGLYMLLIQTNNQKETFKFLVEK